MVYKLAHASEIEGLPFEVSGRLLDNLYEFLIVLDNEYGVERDVDHDDGGYILLCSPGTGEAEIKSIFDFSQYQPEWVNSIEHQPPYQAAMFFLRDDYAVVLVAPSAVATASRTERASVQASKPREKETVTTGHISW